MGVRDLRKIDHSNVVGLSAFEGGMTHTRYVSRALEERVKVLRCLNKADVERLAEVLGSEIVDLTIDDATEWAVAFKPFDGLELYYLLQRYSPEMEDALKVLYSKQSVSFGISGEDISSFTILYANVLIYAAKKYLNKTLPSISRYL